MPKPKPKVTPVFTLGEMRLLRILYYELSIEELSIFSRKRKEDIEAIAEELELSKEEVNHA